jgi:hypothetical protein
MVIVIFRASDSPQIATGLRRCKIIWSLKIAGNLSIVSSYPDLVINPFRAHYTTFPIRIAIPFSNTYNNRKGFNHCKEKEGDKL